MNRSITRFVPLAAGMLLFTFSLEARAQSGLQSDINADLSDAAEKVAALTDVLDDTQYAWSPGEGVRTSAQVILHIAATNYLIPGFWGCTPPADADAPKGWNEETMFEGITDRVRIHSQVRDSFTFARSCVANATDADLEMTVNMFGRAGTGRSALLLLSTHLHEHLGQLIAYARMNGVVPPWSN